MAVLFSGVRCMQCSVLNRLKVYSKSKMERKYQCKNVVASGHTANNLSRHNLLQWINDLLGVKLKKVEALCSGAEYCQFMDILFPGCIPVKKIKFGATTMTEYWSNFKELQKAFRAVGCEKDVPIGRIIEGRFQENFEFLQWFRRFYDANTEEPLSKDARPEQAEKRTSQPGTSRMHTRPVAVVNPIKNQIKGKPEKQMEVEIQSQILEYQERAEILKEEKDIFFTKLRKIELLCNIHESTKIEKKDLVSKILTELYATSEESEALEEDV